MGDLPQTTDILVIGGGPGGYVAALRAASLGKKVTLVEREKLGGMCLHYGCIPSKTLIHAANFVEDTKHAEEIGISAKAKVNVEKLRAWKEKVIGKLNSGIEGLCKRREVSVIAGSAEFESLNRVVVHLAEGKQGIEFSKVIIATGSKAIEIKGFSYDHPRVWNARKALALSCIPESLVVVGGGYIGLEMGFMYAKLGSKVTIVEALPEFLPRAEPETRRLLQKRMKELGVELFLDTKAVGFKEKGKKILMQTSHNELETDYILVAIGHKPFTEGLRLENAQVAIDERGFIKTNEHMQTNQAHIYAVGDVRGDPFLAHKAYLEGKVAAEHACGLNVAFQAKVIPSVIFCDPEIASAGMTEAQAKAAGFNVKSSKFPFQASSRALSMNATDGFVKVVADENNVILGVEIVGPEASELIGEAVLAIEMGASVEDFALSIHPHPTLSEGLVEAMENFLGKGVHTI